MSFTIKLLLPIMMNPTSNVSQSKGQKKIHLLPNVITAFGLTCGLFAIFKMTMIPVGGATYPDILAAVGLLLLAALADLLDGAAARAMKAESDFGGFFDSLADAISFGVAPSVIILKSLSAIPGTQLSFFLTSAVMVFSVCGVLRLVRFSVTSMHAKGNAELTLAQKKNFTGLPIPAAAAAAVSLNLFLAWEPLKNMWPIGDVVRIWILIAALIILGYFMISRWKFPSIKTLEIRVASFQLVVTTVLFAVLLVYGILHFFPVVFVLASWIYLVIAGILSIARLIAGRKSKTLEDFEPEPDDFDDEQF